MNNRRKIKQSLGGLAVVALILGVLTWLFYPRWRQERLNSGLIETIQSSRFGISGTPSALALLSQGADPNLRAQTRQQSVGLVGWFLSCFSTIADTQPKEGTPI